MSYDIELADRMRAILTGIPALTEKKMFGGLAFCVNDHIAVVASGQGGIMVRVGVDNADELVASTPADVMEMRGRPMSGWLRISADDVATDEVLADWVERGVEFASTLPPK